MKCYSNQFNRWNWSDTLNLSLFFCNFKNITIFNNLLTLYSFQDFSMKSDILICFSKDPQYLPINWEKTTGRILTIFWNSQFFGFPTTQNIERKPIYACKIKYTVNILGWCHKVCSFSYWFISIFHSYFQVFPKTI